MLLFPFNSAVYPLYGCIHFIFFTFLYYPVVAKALATRTSVQTLPGEREGEQTNSKLFSRRRITSVAPTELRTLIRAISVVNRRDLSPTMVHLRHKNFSLVYKTDLQELCFNIVHVYSFFFFFRIATIKGYISFCPCPIVSDLIYS